MQVLHSAETIFFCLTLLLAAICCHGKNEMLKVVGFMKHPDIVEGRIKTSQTFSGFRVTIGCRSKDGTIETMGSSEITKEEKFRVYLPHEAVRDGRIRKECYAQVHSAADTSCPLNDNQEPFKIIFQYKSEEKNTIRHSGKLTFSPVSCTSSYLWPFQKPKVINNLLAQETPVTPSSSPSDEPVSTLSPPQPEDLPPAVNPAKNNPPASSKHKLPLDTPASAPALISTPSSPKSKQPPSKHKDFSPAPALSFDPPSPLPAESSPLGPSPDGNVDFSSGPSSGFDTPAASPLPDEPLPLGPSPDANEGFSPAPSIDTPASPLPDEPSPLGPSNNDNVDLSPSPSPSFDTPASPLPDEPLSPSPSPLADSIPFPPNVPSFTHVPSFSIPKPPPIPSVNKPSPPAS
ncbi:hypothetical protein DCAR_0103933 [Daucus carota subsp. sativus]|uniref:Uncharacterized protein n=1 Tax=Daucus carota subsp. sativus TaxID=79200 RepID=A0A166IEH6_DAUCS|nr:PREDICTED: vegetative cell wall protein gp1-like [Daucus carota subsp. sativus]WOG84749.1 hypothetical protein DCAR_0103933 [Daucus carota subsp. sativus]